MSKRLLWGSLVTVVHRYGVNSIFGPTIQGEGALAGVVCLFLRFSGCNMWDGRPQTKADSRCPYCDTEFFSHTMETSDSILARLSTLRTPGAEWVWVSGGEPALQIDAPLLDALHSEHYRVAIETNGTKAFRDGVLERLDHLTLSPKLPPAMTVIERADTLKLLWPHPNPEIRPEGYDAIEAQVRYLQPIVWDADLDQTATNLRSAIELLNYLPGWRLGVQLHKIIGVE